MVGSCILAVLFGGLVGGCQRPALIERSAWGASAPVLEMRPHVARHVTIHHTGTPQRPDLTTEQKIRNLQIFSQREDKLADGRTKPAWADVPYHYYIGVDGRVAVGRDDRFAGDTNTEYDPAGHLLVVVEGNFEEERVLEPQWRALEEIVVWLARREGIAAGEIRSHKDYAATDCPGADLYTRLDDLRWRVLVRQVLGDGLAAPSTNAPGPLRSRD